MKATSTPMGFGRGDYVQAANDEDHDGGRTAPPPPPHAAIAAAIAAKRKKRRNKQPPDEVPATGKVAPACSLRVTTDGDGTGAAPALRSLRVTTDGDGTLRIHVGEYEAAAAAAAARLKAAQIDTAAATPHEEELEKHVRLRWGGIDPSDTAHHDDDNHREWKPDELKNNVEGLLASWGSLATIAGFLGAFVISELVEVDRARLEFMPEPVRLPRSPY